MGMKKWVIPPETTQFQAKKSWSQIFSQTICTSCYSGTRSHRRLIFSIMNSHRINTQACVLSMQTIQGDSIFLVCDLTWNNPKERYFLFSFICCWLHRKKPSPGNQKPISEIYTTHISQISPGCYYRIMLKKIISKNLDALFQYEK